MPRERRVSPTEAVSITQRRIAYWEALRRWVTGRRYEDIKGVKGKFRG
jgi:hypothetical protein